MNSLRNISGKPRRAAITLLIAANWAAFSAPAAPIPVQSFHKDADGVTLAMSPGTMKLTVCSDRIVRVMYSPAATLPAGQDFVVTNHSWPRVSFKVAAAGKITVSTRQLKVAVDKATGAASFYDASGKLLLAEPADGGKTMTAVNAAPAAAGF